MCVSINHVFFSPEQHVSLSKHPSLSFRRHPPGPHSSGCFPSLVLVKSVPELVLRLSVTDEKRVWGPVGLENLRLNRIQQIAWL